MPGTTRDAIDTVVETDDGPDPLRRHRRHAPQEPRSTSGTEYYSLVRALQAVDRADVALLVIDATEGVTHQDQRLAERIDAAGLPDRRAAQQVGAARRRAARRRRLPGRPTGSHFLGDAPVLKICALTGKGVHKLLPALAEAIEAYHRRVPTRRGQRGHPAPRRRRSPRPHGARVLYATQGAADPPTFTLFANRELPPTYLRYLERKLREAFDLGTTPIKLRVRRRS